MNNTQDPALDESEDDDFDGGDRWAWGDDEE
jgi:hypothetical protein